LEKVRFEARGRYFDVPQVIVLSRVADLCPSTLSEVLHIQSDRIVTVCNAGYTRAREPERETRLGGLCWSGEALDDHLHHGCERHLVPLAQAKLFRLLLWRRAVQARFESESDYDRAT
jgi:hypothetical protein